jgi:hypothetical protein
LDIQPVPKSVVRRSENTDCSFRTIVYRKAVAS